jgi:hypothetical protein
MLSRVLSHGWGLCWFCWREAYRLVGRRQPDQPVQAAAIESGKELLDDANLVVTHHDDGHDGRLINLVFGP